MISEKKTEFYTLFKNPNRQWVIEVFCGGFAMYVRRLKLNAEEIRMIEEWGDYYAEKIALDIAKESARLQGRLEEQ